jgi:hypothetical protein
MLYFSLGIQLAKAARIIAHNRHAAYLELNQ